MWFDFLTSYRSHHAGSSEGKVSTQAPSHERERLGPYVHMETRRITLPSRSRSPLTIALDKLGIPICQKFDTEIFETEPYSVARDRGAKCANVCSLDAPHRAARRSVLPALLDPKHRGEERCSALHEDSREERPIRY